MNKKISNERLYEVIRSPLVSEKSTLITQFNHYVFKVATDSSKSEIKNAVEHLFKVKVLSVNTLVQKGKTKKFRGKVGVRRNVKKAFVKLAEGDTIDSTLEVK